jgi:hypothetical protein
VSDIDTAVVDSLKALDLKRPIREADMAAALPNVRFTPESGHHRKPSRCRLSANFRHCANYSIT